MEIVPGSSVTWAQTQLTFPHEAIEILAKIDLLKRGSLMPLHHCVLEHLISCIGRSWTWRWPIDRSIDLKREFRKNADLYQRSQCQKQFVCPPSPPDRGQDSMSRAGLLDGVIRDDQQSRSSGSLKGLQAAAHAQGYTSNRKRPMYIAKSGHPRRPR